MTLFQKSIIDNTSNEYDKMFHLKASNPYGNNPSEIEKFETYDLKVNAFHDRLEREKKLFYSSMNIVNNKAISRQARSRERRHRLIESIKSFPTKLNDIIKKFIITILCLLPTLFIVWLDIRFLYVYEHPNCSLSNTNSDLLDWILNIIMCVPVIIGSLCCRLSIAMKKNNNKFLFVLCLILSILAILLGIVADLRKFGIKIF